MTILPSDIKLRESERMTDTPDGGGRRTNRLVVDGVAGNVFPKVSRVDSVYGRVNFRKVYGHVDTDNTDMYAGAHAIITDAPDNPRIHVCAFSTDSDFDNRTAARDRVESYVTMGPESRMTLYGRQLVGSQALLAYQNESEALPEIGEVYAVTLEAAQAGVTAYQYCRLQDLTQEVREFTDDQGTFKLRVLVMGISAPLLTEFNGIDSPSRISADKGTGRLRTTRVADAARYFGIQPLSNAVSAGDLVANLPSIYTPIVPTTQRETAVSLASPAGASNLIQSATSTLSERRDISNDERGGPASPLYLLRAAVRKSVTLSIVGYGSQGNSVITDDGLGNFPGLGGYGVTATAATIDYESGLITITHGIYYQGATFSATYLPAGAASQAAHNSQIKITIVTRGVVYTPNLLPIPNPGTLLVSFRALGKWYTLRDSGDGVLRGADSTYGTGSVNFQTGGVILTLGALPDVGSSILLSWGSPIHYEILTAVPASAVEIQLEHFPVRKTSLSINWTLATVAKTAIDDGAGLITGDATGTIDYQTGKVNLNVTAAAIGVLAVTYDKTNDPVKGPSSELGGAVLQRTVSMDNVFITFPDGSVSIYPLRATDDGTGKLILRGVYWYGTGDAYVQTNGGNAWYMAGNQQIGEVNYSTGSIIPATSIPVRKKYYRDWDASYQITEGTALLQLATAVYGGTPSALAVVSLPKTQAVTIGTSGIGLSLKLAPLKPMVVVPNSLIFNAYGKVYVDRNGSIYTDVSPATGSGFLAGSINYATGEISLTSYPVAGSPEFSVVACLGKRGDFTSAVAFFRTAGSPLRPASTSIQVTAADGELLSGITNQNGNLTGDGITGQVDQNMGVAEVQFGAMGLVDNVSTWIPRQVMPETLRYSTVVLTNLPLSSTILGLDPVRLPSDGRVLIYRAADVTVVHHTDVYSLGTPAPGATFSMGRTGLSMLWVQDASGTKLPSTLYTANLDAGTVTIAADAVFTGYTLPLNARHRIEEMNLLTDVQINGQISFAAPLLRAYPMGSFISSALLFGDLFARVTGVHDLNTFAGWTDTIGPGATAQFNDIDYPIEVLNDAATSERWRLNFTSPTSYQVIGEQLGVIATGSTTADMQPINLLTGKAYFTLRKDGFGSGWAAGNQLRFNTVGATPPFWLVRTVLPGATLQGDSFDAQLRGDVD